MTEFEKIYQNYNPRQTALDEARALLTAAAKAAMADGALPEAELPAFIVEIPADTKNGDIASNIAMALWRDIAYTGASTLLGFVLGTVIGSVVGLLFWFSRPVAQVAEPWLIVLNALPKLALAPVLVIWFGIGFLSKVILAFLMTVVVAAMSAYSGVRTADPALETLMVSLGARRMQIFTRLIVPSAMPSIITGLRVNIALAMAGSIVGEFIASDRGLGRMIVYAGTTFDLKLVWVGVTTLRRHKAHARRGAGFASRTAGVR